MLSTMIGAPDGIGKAWRLPVASVTTANLPALSAPKRPHPVVELLPVAQAFAVIGRVVNMSVRVQLAPPKFETVASSPAPPSAPPPESGAPPSVPCWSAQNDATT